jgi:hypothetical protein
VPYAAVPFSIFRVAGTNTTLLDLKDKYFEKVANAASAPASASTGGDKGASATDDIMKDAVKSEDQLSAPSGVGETSTAANTAASYSGELTADTLQEVKDLYSRMGRLEESTKKDRKKK